METRQDASGGEFGPHGGSVIKGGGDLAVGSALAGWPAWRRPDGGGPDRHRRQ